MTNIKAFELWFGGGGWYIDFSLIDKILEEFHKTYSKEDKVFLEISEIAERVGIGTPKMETFAKMLTSMNLLEVQGRKTSITEFGGLFPLLIGRLNSCKLEIALYELIKNNSFYNWFFNKFIFSISISGTSFNKDQVKREFISEYSNLILGSEKKFEKELPSLLTSLYHNRGFGEIELFNQESNGTISYGPHVPLIETVSYIVCDFAFLNNLPHITTDHFEFDLFLRKIFLISNPKIEELMNKLVGFDILVMEKIAGLHQYTIKPKYLGRPLQFIQEVLTNRGRKA